MFEISMLGMFFTAFWVLAQPASSTRRNEWWVEVDTDSPKGTYYFGPYDSRQEASDNSNNYIRDLENKGSKKISINIKQGSQPTQLRASEES
ncbi:MULTISPECIES: DUF1816 domain-containing protein [unclassified Microcoleus]|uniref:DUF1816 domain-containing protein n=1 Tax=unclassified Microcoleus TaxID=2642155 RepID=UPI002FD69EC4